MVIPNLTKIKEDFDKVITYSQYIPDPKTDRLFNVWLECKRDFIELFGGKYIYEFPEKVSFDLGPKEKHDRVIRFAGQVASQWGYTDLADFIEKQEDGFFQNLTVEDYTAWDGKVIRKGSKLVKSFRHFVKDNDRSLTDIQNEASRIIQEDKIEGKLCVSVHPLDFLSLSENSHHWRSCHSLDGEYRSGNLSYMTDKSTVICYLKSEEDDFLPRFPFKWNSKKWRTLIYFSADRSMLMAGRQYPFFAETGLDFIVNKLLPESGLLPKEFCIDWHHNYLESMSLDNGETVNLQPYIPIGGALISIQDLVTDLSRLHYNDLLYSSCYTPYYAYLKHEDWMWTWDMPTGFTSPSTRFFIGGEVPCPHCERDSITMNEAMCCDSCYEDEDDENYDIAYCDICGNSMLYDDSEWVDGSILCPHCYETLTSTCDRCGRRVMESELVYNRELKKTLCCDCRLDIAEEEE